MCVAGTDGPLPVQLLRAAREEGGAALDGNERSRGHHLAQSIGSASGVIAEQI